MKSIESRLSKTLLALSVVCGSSVYASHKGHVILHNDETDSFEVVSNGRKYPVQKAFIDKEIRNIDPSLILSAHNKGLVTLTPTQLSDGNECEFGLQMHVNGKGGGPLLAGLFGGIVRIVGYGALGSTAGHAISSNIPQGDRNHPVRGAVSAIGAGKIGEMIGNQAGPGLGGPAGMVSAGIEGSGYSREVAEGTVALAANIPVVVAIEGAAQAATAFGFWVPWW